VQSGTLAGHIQEAMAEAFGLPPGAPVITAIGDNQASLYSTLTDPARQIAFTIGTGCQLSVIVPTLPLGPAAGASPVQYRPYFDGQYAAVAAPLSGGNVTACVADAALDLLTILGMPSMDRGEVLTRLHEAGLNRLDTSLTARPTFWGERHSPDATGGFDGLTGYNFGFADMTAALAIGVVRNAKAMMPPELLTGRREVAASGNAIRRSPMMQEIIRREFGLPLTLSPALEEAAAGAALFAAEQVNRLG
jgi:sedoheptulokinase